MTTNLFFKFLILFFIIVLLIILLIFIGPVEIPFQQILSGELNEQYETILWHIRFPKMMTALFAGLALAATGLVMQTYFNNPLAGPFILGVHSGASLGVALGIMASGMFSLVLPDYLSNLGTVFFAIIGSVATLLLLMIVARKISGSLILLVMGLVFGHMVNGIINILIVISDSHKIKNFLLWSMGSFQRVGFDQLIIFCSILMVCLLLLFTFSKKLNLLLLGDNYAKTSGMNIKQTKYLLLMLTAVLSGTVTAFCGPIAFIGIISPHVARGFFKTTNHFILLPGAILLGSIMAMAGELCTGMMGDITLPINAIFGLMGGPVLLIILIANRKVKYNE